MAEQSSPRILDAVWRNRWSFAAIVGVVVMLSVGVSFLTTGSVTATQRIVLKAPDRAGLLGVEPSSESAFLRYLNQRALFVTSGDVMRGASDELGAGTTVSELRQAVTARTSDAQEAVIVQAVADNANQATAVVTAVVESYRTVAGRELATRSRAALDAIQDRREEIEQTLPDGEETGTRNQVNVQAAAQALSELGQQTTELTVAQAQLGDGVAFVHAPEVNGPSALRSHARNGGIGLGLGVLLAAGFAWVREDRNRQLRDTSALAEIADEPVFAEIERLPDDETDAMHHPPEQPRRSYRLAFAGLQQVVDNGVVVVTGTHEGGSTTSAWQLAQAAARSGLRVLLVDGAIRTRGLTSILGLDDDRHAGLTDLAAEFADLGDVARAIDLGYGAELWAVPAGRTSEGRSEVFRANSLRDLLDQMRSGYDLVIVDAAPPTRAPETTRLITTADAVVIAVRHGTRTSEFLELQRQLTIVGGTIAGYLITDKPHATRTSRLRNRP